MCLRGNVLAGKEESGLGRITSVSQNFFVVVLEGGGGMRLHLSGQGKQTSQINLFVDSQITCEGRAWSCFKGPRDAGKRASPVKWHSGQPWGAGAQELQLSIRGCTCSHRKRISGDPHCSLARRKVRGQGTELTPKPGNKSPLHSGRLI